MDITQKQLEGFLKAYKEPFGISENDYYNLEKYGISKDAYFLMHNRLVNKYGVRFNFPDKITINSFK